MGRLLIYTIILSLFVYNSSGFAYEGITRAKVFTIENELKDFDSWNAPDTYRNKKVIQLSKNNRKKKWKKSKKVTICHIPPGNPDNAHTITVSESSVDAHLEHGDYIGSCEENEPSPQREVGIRDNQADSDCTSIEDIIASIDRYKGHKLTVCGTVVDILTFEFVNFGAFQLDDGTGLIWAIPYGAVPSIRDEVSITGVIEVGATIENIPLGVLIRGFTNSY